MTSARTELLLAMVAAAALMITPVLIHNTPAEMKADIWLPAIFGVIGTLLGTAVSSITSIAIERQKAEGEALAEYFSTLAKLQAIYSDFFYVKRDWLDVSLQMQRETGIENPKMDWRFLQPLITAPTPIEISTSSLSVFLAAKEFGLASKLGETSRQHAMVCGVIEMYNKTRLELRTLMLDLETTTPSSKGAHVTGLDEKAMRRLGPRFHEINSLPTQLAPIVEMNIASSRQTLEELFAAGKKRFGQDKFGKRFVFDDDDAGQRKVSP